MILITIQLTQKTTTKDTDNYTTYPENKHQRYNNYTTNPENKHQRYNNYTTNPENHHQKYW